jgi:hypothetical protein
VGPLQNVTRLSLGGTEPGNCVLSDKASAPCRLQCFSASVLSRTSFHPLHPPLPITLHNFVLSCTVAPLACSITRIHSHITFPDRCFVHGIAAVRTV